MIRKEIQMFKVAILQKRAINAQVDKNIESIIMAMKEASENHALGNTFRKVEAYNQL